jgi:hypothetical protein
VVAAAVVAAAVVAAAVVAAGVAVPHDANRLTIMSMQSRIMPERCFFMIVPPCILYA